MDPKVDARARLRHDLRTPLHQIIGYAELLEDEVRDSGQEKYVADLAKIRDAARKVLDFVDQVVPPASAGPTPPAPAVFRDSGPLPAVNADGTPRGPAVTAPVVPGPRPAAAPVEPRSIRLFVVDDNELNRDMLSRRLGSRGYTVELAEDGERALARLSEQTFDLVLLDVMMPGLSGIDVLKRVR